MRQRLLVVGVSVALVGLTLLAYRSLLADRYEFVSFDDYLYVRDNPHVNTGLSGANLWWALTAFYELNWHPLTWLSLQLDCSFHGLDPRAFHLTNLLLHAANTLLLFVVLRWMTGALWPSAAVAAFFAVHPLHVESVAWVTERKDVLSTLFWLLTLLAYAHYARRPGTGRYLLVFVALALGLMCKAMLVTLPCVLLLLDWWPLRRWPAAPAQVATVAEVSSAAPAARFAPAGAGKLLLEKVPLFVLVAVSALLTLEAQHGLIGNAQQALTFKVRLLNALVSYVVYLRQMFWPRDLAVLYLHPVNELSVTLGMAAGALLAGVTALAVYWRRSRPYFLVGWLWYVGTLLPVIGLLQVGQQAHADRYTYVPLIGIFVMLAWGAAEWLGRRLLGRVVLWGATTALLAACVWGTWQQLPYWTSSATLWDRAVAVSGDNPHLHWIVGKTCLDVGENARALYHTRMLCELKPDDWESHQLYATALQRQNRLAEATRSLARALALRPNSSELNERIALLLWAQGRIPEAFKHYEAVARLDPQSAEGQWYLGTVAQREGRLTEAVFYLAAAVRLAPERVLYHCDLALAHEDRGERQAAGAEYRAALEIDGQWPVACDQLARLLATHPDPTRRDGKEAVRRARQACSVSNRQYPPFLETLAAAYAEAGLFERAIASAEEARKLASEAGHAGAAARLEAAVRRYRAGQPTRDNALQ
jgi:tetratricopeptide (TPR) repeat protein